MKKMFFTAIVMAAYSSASFGNTIEVKENKIESLQLIIEGSCQRVWSYAYNQALQQQMTNAQADCIAWAAWRDCTAKSIDAGIYYGPKC